MNRACFLALLSLLGAAATARSQTFHLPTANRALFEPGGEERFFTGTVGKPYTSGRFGCVRTDGRQMHEGIDIKALQRDRQGEATDSVMASADGVVAYINSRSGLSNYGKYIVLRHTVEGIEVYTLYAHLSQVRSGLRAGTRVGAREVIGILGRTANTRQGISKDRAHVHFEIDLLINERFPTWFKKAYPGQRNDHGAWNGLNMAGLDPRHVFLTQAAEGSRFSLLHFIRNQTELCRVIVRDTSFPWLRRYTPLIRRNAVAEREGVAAYEISLNYNGVPFRLIPRAPSEVGAGPKYQLVAVNDAEQRDHPCRDLVTRTGGRWQLAPAGRRLLEQLTY